METEALQQTSQSIYDYGAMIVFSAFAIILISFFVWYMKKISERSNKLLEKEISDNREMMEKQDKQHRDDATKQHQEHREDRKQDSEMFAKSLDKIADTFESHVETSNKILYYVTQNHESMIRNDGHPCENKFNEIVNKLNKSK